ncbi:hypothetical protein C0993_002864 [Termitomyces sp. T159_Od127]|nr:hypothetical protein C0993_002864 [Termitomyces sp. T159_Od127]
MITLRLQAEETAIEDIEDIGEDNEIAPSRRSVVGAARSIYREHGLMGFWRGFQTTIMLSLNPSMTLAFFQLFRRLLYLFVDRKSFSARSNASQQVDPTPGQAFVGGALCNSIAVCILYPLILAKTRLQASSATSLQSVIKDAYHGVDTRSEKGQGMRTQDATAGLSGLYQGLWLQIVKGFLNQGVTFTMKRRVEELIINEYLRRRRYN